MARTLQIVSDVGRRMGDLSLLSEGAPARRFLFDGAAPDATHVAGLKFGFRA